MYVRLKKPHEKLETKSMSIQQICKESICLVGLNPNRCSATASKKSSQLNNKSNQHEAARSEISLEKIGKHRSKELSNTYVCIQDAWKAVNQ